jgi:hypothetical protein
MAYRAVSLFNLHRVFTETYTTRPVAIDAVAHRRGIVAAMSNPESDKQDATSPKRNIVVRMWKYRAPWQRRFIEKEEARKAAKAAREALQAAAPLQAGSAGSGETRVEIFESEKAYQRRAEQLAGEGWSVQSVNITEHRGAGMTGCGCLTIGLFTLFLPKKARYHVTFVRSGAAERTLRGTF